MFDQPPSPPAHYLPYDGPLVEVRLPLQRLKTMCHVLGARGADVTGCGGWQRGGCLIVIPEIDSRIDKATQDEVRRHELSHCNGWVHR